MTAPQPAPHPTRQVLDGRYARLEPLALNHADDLFAAVNIPDAVERFAYLPSFPFETVEVLREWIVSQQDLADPIVFAVIDKATGRAGGWQQMMRIEPKHGAIEIGYVYWGPAIARTRVATEALYLFARHIFEDLGYRRFEWKCNNRNAPSKSAALRFGFTFEGIFRQHMIVKGESRDTAWFSMLDGEWPSRKAGFERWLAPGNFDAAGQQLSRLSFD
jgi:RimJ/RimL family protein N-acetyltransferase